MKFLEVKLFYGNGVFINIDKIVGLYAISDKYYIGLEDNNEGLKIPRDEYERIIQNIDKVQHL